MSKSTKDQTDRFVAPVAPEDVFDRFVRNANAPRAQEFEEDAPTSLIPVEQIRADRAAEVGEAIAIEDDAEFPESEFATAEFEEPAELEEVLLLTRRKTSYPPPPLPPPPLSSSDIGITPEPWESLVQAQGRGTQIREASRVVPDVQAIEDRVDSQVGEGAEPGEMPTRQLTKILEEMAVLVRYGHRSQARQVLDQLRKTYPEDLLLLRSLAEFFVEQKDRHAAMEMLFSLATGLFERRNIEGMRQALQQVLALQPGNARARKLIDLVDSRPGEGG